MQNQSKGVLLATTTAFLWALLAIGLKVALNYFDPYTVVWFRFFVATICLSIYFMLKKPSYLKVFQKPHWMMLLAGFFLGCNYIGYMQGVNFAGPAATQIVIQTGPILLGFIGFVFFKESLSPLRAIGFVVATIGFAIFYTYQLTGFGADKDTFIKGIAWILFAAVSWTTYAVFNKKLVTYKPPQQVNLIVFALPTLLFLPLVDFSLFTQAHTWWVWLLMTALGLNTLVAYGTLAASFKYTEANRIGIIITLNPIITLILLEIMMVMDVQWFEIKQVPLPAFLGAALVIGGAILAVGINRK